MESKTFDAKKFPFSTKNPELVAGINKLIKAEETPLAERVEKLAPAAKGTIRLKLRVL